MSKKTRYDYTCGESHIVIDDYPLVGTFIEIEKVVNKESEVKEAKKKNKRILHEVRLIRKG